MVVLLDLPAKLLVQVGRSVRNIRRHDLVSLCLTNQTLKTVLMPILWEEVTIQRGGDPMLWPADEKRLHTCLQILATSDEVAAAVRTLTILRIYVDVDCGCAPVSWCALLAAGLRRMSGLLELTIDLAGFHGPAVIAALCAREESSLQKIGITIGRVRRGDDFSELKDLKLKKGNLVKLGLLTSQRGGYPQQYVDALARIYDSSRSTIEDLHITRWHEEAMLSSSSFKVFPKLRKLSLWEINLEKNAILADTVYSNLRQLKLYCMKLPSTDLMSSLPTRFPSLRCLSLYVVDASSNDDNTVGQVGKLVIACMPELRAIKLYYPDDSDGDVEREHTALRQWDQYSKNLKTVIFDHGGDTLRYWQRGRDNAWVAEEISRHDSRL